MRALGIFITSILLIIFGTLLGGWALTVLWGWFVVPTFHLPSLSLAPAIGVNIVVSFLTYQYVDTETPKRSFTETLFVSFLILILRVGTILGMGWLVHLFM